MPRSFMIERSDQLPNILHSDSASFNVPNESKEMFTNHHQLEENVQSKSQIKWTTNDLNGKEGHSRIVGCFPEYSSS